MYQFDESAKYYETAKQGFKRLLGEGSAKYVEAAYRVALRHGCPSKDDEKIADLKALWAMAETALPYEGITYFIATDLGIAFDEKGEHEEAKVYYLAALEGRRRVLGEDHKDTLDTVNNLGVLSYDMGDYEGALAYYEEALKGEEKILGRAHPARIGTLMNMAIVYDDGMKDYDRGESLYRQALEGYEKSLGKEHEHTKDCVKNLARLYAIISSQANKVKALVLQYPFLLEDDIGVFLVHFLDESRDE